uniref:Uncharacterized protein n=1 Tax=Meloidogyne enterolobii TaxID=390850 RepID=A0A6V7X5S7_MELEN|nr:unnamed protein product [Meloidogyne enterolobii]
MRVIPARATRLDNGHFELTDICEKCEDISLVDSEFCPHHQSQHTQLRTTESQHSNCESVGKNVATERKTKKVVRVGSRRRMGGCRVRYSKALRIGKKIVLTALCENGSTRVVVILYF